MPDLELTIVPDKHDDQGAEMLVDGRVGDRSYRFLLDTGAAQSRLGFDEYTSTFPAAEGDASMGVFGPTSRETINVPSIEVGPIRAVDFAVVRAPEGRPESHNLIGMDLLKSKCLYFRFDETRVSVLHTPPKGLTYHNLLIGRREHPYVQVVCGGTTAMAVWDTGASLTVVDEAFRSRLPSHFHEVGVSTGTDSGGTAQETNTYTMGEVKIGGLTFRPHHVAAVDLSAVNSTLDIPMDMILGYSTMRLANWIFDFPGKKWAAISVPPSI